MFYSSSRSTSDEGAVWWNKRATQKPRAFKQNLHVNFLHIAGVWMQDLPIFLMAIGRAI